jgi:hypothetical protein
MNNPTTRTLAAAIVLMLTAATITPLAAFAYNGGTNGKTITEQDQSVARVKPQVDLNVPASAGADVKAPTNRDIMTLGDKWWNWAFSIDTSEVDNPFTDTGTTFCDVGKQKGNLLFLVGTAGEITTSGGTSGHTGDVRTCDTPIPRGTYIFFPLFNTECSVLETPCTGQPGLPACPDDSSEDVLRACAVDIVDHVKSLTLTIDGVPSTQLAKRVQSGPGGFQLTVVPNNPFISDPNSPLNVDEATTTTSVSDGYWVLLKATSLRPGVSHTITFGALADFPELGFTFRTEVTYNIIVK